MRPDLIRTLRASASGALPTLGMIGLVYTGLGGVAAMVLMISVALVPTAPNLQQVTEPARQAVTGFVQPTGDLVTSFIAPPSVPLVIRPVIAPRPATFLAATTLNITIDESAVVDEEPAPVESLQLVAPAPRFVVPQGAPVAEEQPVEDVQPDDFQIIEAPAAQPEIVQAPETPSLQIAAAEEPRALPTPPLTPEQQNHAVIEANKAAAAQAKTDADAANQAAIAAARAAAAQAKAEASAANAAAIAAANAPAMAGSGLALPSQSGAAAKAAAAQAKADANAANAAAIAAAKAAKAAPKH